MEDVDDDDEKYVLQRSRRSCRGGVVGERATGERGYKGGEADGGYEQDEKPLQRRGRRRTSRRRIGEEAEAGEGNVREEGCRRG